MNQRRHCIGATGKTLEEELITGSSRQQNKWWGGSLFVPPPSPAKRLPYAALNAELEHLVRYWAINLLDVQFCCHAFHSGGSEEFRIIGIAVERLNTLKMILGAKSFAIHFDQAETDYAEAVGPEAWAEFRGVPR